MDKGMSFSYLLILLGVLHCLVNVSSESDFFEMNSDRDLPEEKRSFFDTNRNWDTPWNEKRTFFDSNRNWDLPRGYKRSFFDSNRNWDLPRAEKRTFFDSNSNWDLPRGEKRTFFDSNRNWDLPRGEKRTFFDSNRNWDLPRGEKRTFFDSNRNWDLPRGEKRTFFDSNRNWDLPRGEKRTFFDSNRNWDLPSEEKRTFFDTYSNWDVPLAQKRTFFDTYRNWDIPEKRSLFPEQWDTEKRYWDTEVTWPRGKRWSWRRPSYTSDFWATEVGWPRGKRDILLEGPSGDQIARGKRYISPYCKRCLFQSDDWISCNACYRRGSMVPFYGTKKRAVSAAVSDVGEKRSYETSFYGLEDGNGRCGCCQLDNFNYMCCLECTKRKRK